MTLSIEDPSVDAARSGDRAAWEDLYRRFHPAVQRYLEILAPEADPEQIWARAAHALPGQPVGVKPLVWLFRVARECMVGDADPAAADDLTIAAIRRLPPLQREIITMRVVGRLTDGDVAAVVGWPETRVAAAAHAALTDLQIVARLAS